MTKLNLRASLLAGAFGAAFLALAFFNPALFHGLQEDTLAMAVKPPVQVAEQTTAPVAGAAVAPQLAQTTTSNTPSNNGQLMADATRQSEREVAGSAERAAKQSEAKKETHIASADTLKNVQAGQSAENLIADLPAASPPAMAKRLDGRAMQSFAPQTGDAQPSFYAEEGRDKFEHINSNSVKQVAAEPVSTFSVDVDSSSYSFIRSSLNNNVLPQKDAVRVEEMINYFPYDYAVPSDKAEPFKPSMALMPCPWNKEHLLLHVGIKGYQLEVKEKPRSNLVFLLDTSGSMNEPNKLPLLKNSLKLLLDNLQADDRVAIVTYAGSAGTALEPTKVSEKSKILAALDNLEAGGSTAGAEGIRQAYLLAEQNFDKEGVNRVILATDGDFNVGITNQDELKSFIERKRNTGIYLSVLGFGRGNYNDALMQTLAQNGNGNAAYIDNLNEARKVLVDEASSTLFTIAKDVKIQVEFNPAQISEYRLIGYENRLLKREDFNNDQVDAGEIGAGHAVTAIYELTPINAQKMVDDLRYQPSPKVEVKAGEGEYGFLKIRYKLPSGDKSRLITAPIDQKIQYKSLEEAPLDSRFASAVAGFGQLLRSEPYLKNFTYEDVIKLAEESKGKDSYNYRGEFISLVRLAKGASALNSPQ